MTNISENYHMDALALSTGLVHAGSNVTNYLQIFNKRKRTRWDYNPKPSKYNYNNNLDIQTVSSRKSRWRPASEKTFTPLPYTQIPEELDIDSFEILLRKYRLDDVNRRIQANDWENMDPDLRSPSPEPIYDSKGHRLNVRDVRTKEKYIKEKNSLIENLITLDETYKPPHDYRPPRKIKKIFISEIENEKHKLVGLILGVGGATQRELEKKSGCKISVRGKGSSWKGTLNADFSVYDESEPLHVYVQAETDDQIMKACSIIDPILDPYSQEHAYYKQMQKQAIAVMYGYQTDTSCENCGEKHRTWACPLHIGNFEKIDVRCAICHDKSHPTIDCPEREKVDDTVIETELMKFMRDLDDFKKTVDIPVLEAEIQADNIRNSILYTGKMPDMENYISEHDATAYSMTGNMGENVNVSNRTDIVHENYSNYNSELERNTSQIYQATNTTTNYESGKNLNADQTNNNMSNTQASSTPLDYKVPMMPIVNNPNVIRSAPVNYMTANPLYGNQNFNPATSNNYYPYMPPPINGIGYFPLNPNLQNAYTKNFNLISGNFQGKIPNNYQSMNLSPLLNYPSKNKIYDYQSMKNYNYALNSNNNANSKHIMIQPQYGGMNIMPNINVSNQVNEVNGNYAMINNHKFQTPYVPNAPNFEEEIPQPPEPEDDPGVKIGFETNQYGNFDDDSVVNKENMKHEGDDQDDVQVENI